jgi:hypothetical protein
VGGSFVLFQIIVVVSIKMFMARRKRNDMKRNTEHDIDEEKNHLSACNLVKMKGSYRHPWLKLKTDVEDFYNEGRHSYDVSPMQRVRRLTDINVKNEEDFANLCNIENLKLAGKM